MKSLKPISAAFASAAPELLLGMMLAGLCASQSGCATPIGADKTTPTLAYRQIHDNPVSHGQPPEQYPDCDGEGEYDEDDEEGDEDEEDVGY